MTIDTPPPTDPGELFDTDDLEHVEGDKPNARLGAVHAAGKNALTRLVDNPDTALLRTRDAAWLVGYPERAWQVTVRAKTPGGADAEEFQKMQDGRTVEYAYGFVRGNELYRAVVLNAANLAGDIIDRPGCLIPASRSVMTHHAPGGAEFYVVDIRRLRPDTVKRWVGYPLSFEFHTAPLASQTELF